MGAGQSEFDYGTHETRRDIAENVQNVNEFETCVKKKFHQGFIASEDFTIEHLPEGYREQDIFELTTKITDLTVKIIVKYVSPSREKERWQKTKQAYPFSEMAGTSEFTSGSGRISDVFPNTEIEKYSTVTCPCTKCKDEQSATGKVWLMKVYTATHVVFDTTEAKKTVCRLFYNSQQSETVDIYGLDQRCAHVDGDLCILTCVTHDESLAIFIKETIKTFNALWRKLQNNKTDNDQEDNKLIIIVSHPHGWPKKISVGLWEECVQLKKYGGHRYTYKMSTCPGSSGAPVYILGMDWFHTAYCHSAANKKLNYTTLWIPRPK